MIKIVAIANQKGGVGKTTTAINLAVGLQVAHSRVLLVDLDPQANATSGLGIQPTRQEPHFLALDTHQATLPSLWRQARDGGLMLLPSGPALSRIDRLLSARPQSHLRLRDHLRAVSGRFDYVVIDCPPSVGPLTANALVAADSVLVPIQSEYLAMEGLSQMLAIIRQIQAAENPGLELEGILITLHDPRLELAEEVERELREHVGEAVYHTRIVRDVALAECPSHGMAIIDYAPASAGSLAYQRFVREFLASQRQEPQKGV
jgi:chromosome partitioning protein